MSATELERNDQAMPHATPLGEHRYRVPRETGTFADVFTAAGLADLLATTTANSDVRITGEPTAFVVSTVGFDPAVHAPAPAAGYPYLRIKEADAVPAAVPAGAVVSYWQERERVARHYELRTEAAKNKSLDDPVVRDQLAALRPRGDWRQLQVLDQLQGLNNTNAVLAAIAGLEPSEAQREILDGLAALAAGRSAEVGWQATSVKLFNPGAAKGYARLKPDGTKRNDKTKDAWTNPFVEWLRYRGYFVAACPFFLGGKSDRVRVFCPIPADISLAALRGVADVLRRLPMQHAAPKLDALTVLRLARVLIDHSEYSAADQADDDLPRFLVSLRDAGGGTPASVIAGVAITHYQSSGKAKKDHIVSELSALALPGWFPVASVADADAWRTALDEHRRIVVGLQHDRSDEIGLLIAYRRFLEGRGARAADLFLEARPTTGCEEGDRPRGEVSIA